MDSLSGQLSHKPVRTRAPALDGPIRWFADPPPRPSAGVTKIPTRDLEKPPHISVPGPDLRLAA